MSFRVEHLANFGTGEPWVSRLMLELPKFVDVTTIERRNEVKEGIGAVYFALTDAFNDLRELRRLEQLSDVPVSERQAAFSSFYVHLWRAYKDRFQSLVSSLGYELGFLWQNDAAFETGAQRFLEERLEVDPCFLEMLRDDRRAWQTKLADFRNHLEHQTPLDAKSVATFYRLESAELAFENVWEAIEDITVSLLRPHLPTGVELAEIPEEQRDPSQSRRFGFTSRA